MMIGKMVVKILWLVDIIKFDDWTGESMSRIIILSKVCWKQKKNNIKDLSNTTYHDFKTTVSLIQTLVATSFQHLFFKKCFMTSKKCKDIKIYKKNFCIFWKNNTNDISFVSIQNIIVNQSRLSSARRSSATLSSLVDIRLKSTFRQKTKKNQNFTKIDQKIFPNWSIIMKMMKF